MENNKFLTNITVSIWIIFHSTFLTFIIISRTFLKTKLITVNYFQWILSFTNNILHYYKIYLSRKFILFLLFQLSVENYWYA